MAPSRSGAMLASALVLMLAGCGTAKPRTASSAAATPSSPVTVAWVRPTPRTAERQRQSPSPPATEVVKPRIVWDPIRFGSRRVAEMVRYAERHYGLRTAQLVHPHVIVIHYTDGPSFLSAFNAFSADVPDSELGELPGTCAHYVVDRSGVIHQLVPVRLMCRHTVGLNWTAIGVENVGYSDQEILGDRRQLSASLRLVRWLRCRFHIPVADVIGHNESLVSPYHHENVMSLRTQTHGDWVHADMQIYRHRLRQLGSCPAA